MDINDQCEQPTKEETEKEKELINCMHQRLQDSFRVKIDCVPRFFGVAQLRKIIQRFFLSC
jgi:hypothetical protein